MSTAKKTTGKYNKYIDGDNDNGKDDSVNGTDVMTLTVTMTMVRMIVLMVPMS